MSEIGSSVNSSVPRNTGEMLERALRRARWTTFCERLWPPIATLANAVGIFLAASWLRLWLWLPPIGRVIGAGRLLSADRGRDGAAGSGAFSLSSSWTMPARPQYQSSPPSGDRDERSTRDPEVRPWSTALWRAHVERALLAARAQGLAQQLQQQMEQNQGPGPYGLPGRLCPQNRAQQETDPLGRPMRHNGDVDELTVKVAGEIDAQRAPRIIEELRRRFGEAFWPQFELDYIERLLKDY